MGNLSLEICRNPCWWCRVSLVIAVLYKIQQMPNCWRRLCRRSVSAFSASVPAVGTSSAGYFQCQMFGPLVFSSPNFYPCIFQSVVCIRWHSSTRPGIVMATRLQHFPFVDFCPCFNTVITLYAFFETAVWCCACKLFLKPLTARRDCSQPGFQTRARCYNPGLGVLNLCCCSDKRKEKYWRLTKVYSKRTSYVLANSRDAPIMHWPIIGRPIIGAKQSADYRPINTTVPETGQKPAVHTVYSTLTMDTCRVARGVAVESTRVLMRVIKFNK